MAPAALALPVPVLIAAIGAQRVLIPSSAVVEVSRPATLTRVPGLPGWILGLTNARGQVLSVLDIRRLLDPDADERAERPAARPRLMIVESGPIRVGVLVDAVEGVAELPSDDCEPLPMGVSGGGLLRGMVTVGAAPAVLLDPAALVALRNQLAG